MYGLIILFLFIITLKYINFGCTPVIIVWFLFSSMIFYQLVNFKKNANLFYCHACRKGKICKALCESLIFDKIIMVPLSIIMSFSLISFIYLTNIKFFIFILFDFILFYYLYKKLSNNSKSQVKKYASPFTKDLLVSFANLTILALFLLLYTLLYETNSNVRPEDFNLAVDNTIKNIHHSCSYFQDYLRTMGFIDEMKKSVVNLPKIGMIIYMAIVVFSFSIVPFSSLTLLMKFFQKHVNKYIIKQKEIK